MSKLSAARRESAADRLTETLARLRGVEQLASPNAFVRELKLPPDLYAAFMTGRPEMIALAKPTPLDAEQAQVLYKVIQGLLQTNQALRDHANEVSGLMVTWNSMLTGLTNTGRKIEHFANFRDPGENEDEEDEWKPRY